MVAFGKTASRLLRLGGVIIALGILLHLALRIKAFIHIFFDHAGVLLNQEDVLRTHTAGGSRLPVVPRITHQIFHNWTHPADETLPHDWNATRQTCLDANTGWVHHVSVLRRSGDTELTRSLPAVDRKIFRRLHCEGVCVVSANI